MTFEQLLLAFGFCCIYPMIWVLAAFALRTYRVKIDRRDVGAGRFGRGESKR